MAKLKHLVAGSGGAPHQAQRVAMLLNQHGLFAQMALLKLALVNAFRKTKRLELYIEGAWRVQGVVNPRGSLVQKDCLDILVWVDVASIANADRGMSQQLARKPWLHMTGQALTIRPSLLRQKL